MWYDNEPRWKVTQYGHPSGPSGPPRPPRYPHPVLGTVLWAYTILSIIVGILATLARLWVLGFYLMFLNPIATLVFGGTLIRKIDKERADREQREKDAKQQLMKEHENAERLHDNQTPEG
jgi:hypothetical protein